MFIKIFTIIRKLLYSTGNPTQCSVMACMGKDSKKKGGDIYIKIWLPMWNSGKESVCQCRRRSFDHLVGKIPWSQKWQPTPVFLPEKFHGQRN